VIGFAIAFLVTTGLGLTIGFGVGFGVGLIVITGFGLAIGFYLLALELV
jgi:hypothetical protein